MYLNRSSARYQYYKYVLGKIGFIIENFSFTKHSGGGQSFQMAKVALAILTAIATGPAMAVVTAAITVLGQMADDSNQIKLFGHQASHDKMGNFQVAACDQAPNGDVTLAFGVFYFEANKNEVNFLFFTWKSSDVSLYKGDQKTVLNEEVYATVRESIKKKLGQQANDLVDGIDL